ncbi:MAG: siphovirus Gp157 family protein [Oscillospiraceae bacterium]|nr:siphovirus Gp157 family protein [Oscillospiraceae bacterium]
MTLYEIDNAITNCIDSETGEVLDEEALTALVMERTEKIESVGCWIKNLEAEAEAIKVERDKLAQRQRTAENRAESLRRWLAGILNGEKFTTAKVAVSFRKSVAVQIDEDKLDKKYFVEKSVTVPDKTAIRNALKSGEKISGAYLEEKQNIQIK